MNEKYKMKVFYNDKSNRFASKIVLKKTAEVAPKQDPFQKREILITKGHLQ